MGELTDEDIIPIWLRKKMLEFMRHDESRGPAPARLKRRICAGCNGALSRTFENAAAPLLGRMVMGESVELRPREQVIAAAWLMKTALINKALRSRLSSPDDLVPVAGRERQQVLEMMGSGLPPANSSVRIAPILVALDSDGAPVTLPVPTPIFPPGWPRDNVGFASILVYGVLAAEIVWGGSVDVLPYVAATPSDGIFLRVWPPLTRPQSWPTRGMLSMLQFAMLNQGWNTSIKERYKWPFVDRTNSRYLKPEVQADASKWWT